MRALHVELRNDRKASRHLMGDDFVDIICYTYNGGESTLFKAFRFSLSSRGDVKVKRIEDGNLSPN